MLVLSMLTSGLTSQQTCFPIHATSRSRSRQAAHGRDPYSCELHRLAKQELQDALSIKQSDAVFDVPIGRLHQRPAGLLFLPNTAFCPQYKIPLCLDKLLTDYGI